MMKDKLKKMLCVLTAASFIAALSSCGNNKSNSSSKDEPISASETVKESETGSPSQSESVSESVSESEPESNSESTSESSSESEKPAPELKITSPEGIVYPYLDIVKNYLESDKGVEEFYEKVGNAYAPVAVEWKNTYENVQSVKVEYSVNEDMTDAEETELEGYKTKLNLYNLLKGTKYYVRVTAKLAGGEEKTALSSFETTDLGARFMKIDGIFNVRDLGGYKTASGETTLQNMFFRGGALSPESHGWYDYVKLSDSGKKYMSEKLGIKTDFDLRTAPENLNLTASPIPGANLEYYGVGGYLSAFTETAAYRKVFSALSDKTKYPVYLHCTGGADRTGTISFIVNALLGVDERTLIQDYELTSFSIYELRNYNGTTYQFKDFVEKLKTYEGDTLQQKTENYLLSIGVTETEIYNIKAIMLGKETKTDTTEENKITLDSTSKRADGETVIGYNGTIASVKIDSATDDGNGGTYFMIGSYGVYFRGSLFRYAVLKNGAYGEYKDSTNTRINLDEYPRASFNAGVKLGVSVKTKDDNTVTISIYINDKLLGEHDLPRIENEINDDEAKFSVEITSHVINLIINGGL